ncbi:MAG: hypothetical protein FH761_05580 [Firmicutes bacterium]|nr:hypothetical protein [Bacillota bacterium]
MDRKLKQELKQSLTPPPTRHKAEFINSISYPKARFREVLFSQIGFIRKRVWLFYVLATCFAYFYTTVVKVPANIVAVVSAILPLFSLCIITEIYRSTAYNMAETELACKYNLQKITLMRLGILGTASFVMLILLVIIAGKNDLGVFRNSVYIGVPYLLSSYLSLEIISRFRSKETIYVCMAVCCAVSVFMMIANNLYQFIYSVQFITLWVGTFMVLMALTLFSFNQFIKSQEELQWSLL